MTNLKPVLMTLALLCLVAQSTHAAAGWRMDGTGCYADADPPTEWSADKNVVWKTALPNWSNASPVLSGGRIFVCAEPSTLICVSASDGAILWQAATDYLDTLSEEEAATAAKQAAKGEAIKDEIKKADGELRKINRALKDAPDDEELKKKQDELKTRVAELRKEMEPFRPHMNPDTHGVNGYTSPTPVTDGTHVYALFGSGVAACFDTAGNRKWARLLERPTHGWGHSSSPLLAGGLLLCHIKSVHALDPATGDTKWQTGLPSAWGSPVVARIAGAELAVTPSGAVLDALTGDRIDGNVPKLDYCAPLVSGNIAYFVQHGGGAVELKRNDEGAVELDTLWQTAPPKERYYASPAMADGILYGIMQKGVFSAIDAASGEVIYSEELKLGGTAYPSVTLAGNYLFVSSDNGQTAVIKPGRTFEELTRNTLEPFRASPVFQGSRMYVRTQKHLYCIGQ